MSIKKCPNCKEPIQGRSDKKFCSPYCKSAYHYQKNKEKEDDLYTKIDTQLKTNRRILKTFNKAGKATVRKDVLLKEGFVPKYFTHYCRNGVGKTQRVIFTCSVMSLAF